MLDSKRADDFNRIIKKVVDRQLDQTNTNKIMRKFPKESWDELTRDQLHEAAKDEVPQPDPSPEEEAALLALLLWSAGQGMDKSSGAATADEIAEARAEISANVSQRLNVILYGTQARTDAPPPPHIANPNLPNGGGIDTAYFVALYLHAAIRQLLKDDEPRTMNNIGDEFDTERYKRGESGATRDEERANLITWEMARATAVGLYFIGLARGARYKTWLETESANPRAIHLAQVGVTIPYNTYFPDGSFWSNEQINCKCGIKLRWNI